MDINYEITTFFEENNLFDNSTSDGLEIKKEDNAILIKGNSKDLVELADLLVNVAKSKEQDTHIHIDDLTLLSNKSEFKEIIIEKN